MRHLAWLEILLFSFLSTFKLETTVTATWPIISSNVKLLGLFPQQTQEESKKDMWTIHCRSMFKAAILLSQKFNITFQGKSLDYDEIITDDQDIMITIDHTCEKVSSSNIVGFVGPAYSSEARVMSSLAYRLGILTVSYSATSPDLSAANNGAFYRVVPSDENTALSIIALFQQYKWKSSIIIYQNDEYGYEGMKLLTQKFNQINVKTKDIIKFDINQQRFEVDLKKTLIDSFSRIVIVWANEKSTTEIINKALDDDLLGSDFVWILTKKIPLARFKQRDKKNLIGILCIEPDKGDLADISVNKALLDEAYELWKTYDSETFPGESNVSSFALFSFDATWSLILALEKLCSTELSCLEFVNVSNCFNHRFVHWKQYYNIIKTVSFMGVSGEVKFSNETTDRDGPSYYIMKNIQPSGRDVDYIPVLIWDISSTNWISEKNEYHQIIWPNLSKDLPADHKLIRDQELRIAIIQSPPFIILKNPTIAYSDIKQNFRKIDLTEFEGIYKDILLYLMDKMNFNPVAMLANQTTQYNDLVNGVVNGLFDTVMSTIIATEKRKKLVDFSTALIPSSVHVVTRKPKSIQLDALFFLRPFSWALWLLLIATTLYISLLLWWFERTNSKQALDDNHINDRHISVRRSISYTTSILLGKDSFSLVKTKAGQLLIFGAHILQIILFAVYTASLLSYIIKQNSNSTISGLDDIVTGKIPPKRIGLVEGSAIQEFYSTNLSPDKQDYYHLKSSDEIYTSLINNEVDAALWTNLSIAYHINNKYCDLMTAGVDFWLSSYQLPIRSDWPYKADLDSHIYSLIDSQELDRILTRWTTQRTCDDTDSFYTRTNLITVETMWVLFAILAGISVISILLRFWSEISDFIRNKTKLIMYVKESKHREGQIVHPASCPPNVSLDERSG